MYKVPLVFWSMGELGILLLRFTDLYGLPKLRGGGWNCPLCSYGSTTPACVTWDSFQVLINFRKVELCKLVWENGGKADVAATALWSQNLSFHLEIQAPSLCWSKIVLDRHTFFRIESKHLGSQKTKLCLGNVIFGVIEVKVQLVQNHFGLT